MKSTTQSKRCVTVSWKWNILLTLKCRHWSDTVHFQRQKKASAAEISHPSLSKTGEFPAVVVKSQSRSLLTFKLISFLFCSAFPNGNLFWIPASSHLRLQVKTKQPAFGLNGLVACRRVCKKLSVLGTYWEEGVRKQLGKKTALALASRGMDMRKYVGTWRVSV